MEKMRSRKYVNSKMSCEGVREDGEFFITVDNEISMNRKTCIADQENNSVLISVKQSIIRYNALYQNTMYCIGIHCIVSVYTVLNQKTLY